MLASSTKHFSRCFYLKGQTLISNVIFLFHTFLNEVCPKSTLLQVWSNNLRCWQKPYLLRTMRKDYYQLSLLFSLSRGTSRSMINHCLDGIPKNHTIKSLLHPHAMPFVVQFFLHFFIGG